MPHYTPPNDEQIFTLQALVGIHGDDAFLGQDAFSLNDLRAVLSEAGRVAVGEPLPLRHSSDHHGCLLADGAVLTPPGVRDAYRQLAQGGWISSRFPLTLRGQDLPHAAAECLEEIWNVTGVSFVLCPMLTQSAIEALLPFGSEEQRADFTMPMLQGRWSGTMNLTEPQAGLDLSSVQCKAKVALDGSFRISGQKILVTYGDHDLTDNTIHMVLARLPDAPPIVKGISMFIVPKFLQGTAGAWNVRNEVRRFSIEHKLGIRGSPICTMHFGEDEGAVAFLVGAANKGLDYMFTMMNTARFAVGLEGLGVASAAHQVALQYSTERVQGFPNSPHWRTIAGHPYVKQMLLCIESHVMFMRSLCVTAGGKIDQLSLDGGPMSHEHAPSPVDLLTHVVKGWCTEHAQEALSLAPQVHLASGYIEETGIAQLLRDVRVTTLYEGTTAIQANDLVFRKVLRDSGKAANRLAAELETTAAISQSEAVEHQAIPSANGGEIMSTFHTTLPWLDARGRSDLPRTRAGAVALLDLFGYCAAAWCVGRLVIHAQRLTKRGVMHAAQERRVTLARVFLELAAGRSICSPRKANRVAYAVTEFPDSVLIAA